MNNITTLIWTDHQFGMSLACPIPTKSSESKEDCEDRFVLPCPEDQLIAYLSQDPTLKECYGRKAGVSEGYTIEEHTQQVLRVASKFKASFQKQVETLVTWDEFLLFLALHDIGKGIAKEKESEAFGSSVSFKKSELDTTKGLIQTTMGRMKIDPKKIALFCEMLRYDTQGLYLKDEIGTKGAFDSILEMARNAGCDPVAFYELFSAYHSIDAASYPALFGTVFKVEDGFLLYSAVNQEKVDALRRQLVLVIEGEKCFEHLRRIIKEGSATEAKRYFLVHLDALTQHLFAVHKEMLHATDAPTQNREKFRLVKKTYRDFFLHIFKHAHSRDIETFKKKYEDAIHKRFGRRDFMEQMNCFILPRLFFPELQQKELEWHPQFFEELMNFRKNYLCRFSIAKVVAFVKKEYFKQFNEELDSVDTTLLNTTFMHGTNSALLPNLLRTGMQLLPTGRLFRVGIIPFSGELERGSTAMGVNRYGISGTNLDNASESIKYATSTNFQTNPQSEQKDVMKFLDKVETEFARKTYFRDQFSLCSLGGSWTRLAISILRWRALNPESFALIKERLEAAIKKVDQDYKEFKATDLYKKIMPKSRDPDKTLGYGWHDDYWYEHIITLNGAIEKLNSSVSEPVTVVKGMQEAIQKPYGLIFVSKTIHPTYDLRKGNEVTSQNGCQVGTDIHTVLTMPEKRKDVEEFFAQQQMEKLITFGHISDLTYANAVNKMASPYFADFASSKKMGEILDERTIYFV